jgi:hypothetical protein
LTRALPIQVAGQINKERHVGSRQSKPWAGRRSRTHSRNLSGDVLNISAWANQAMSLNFFFVAARAIAGPGSRPAEQSPLRRVHPRKRPCWRRATTSGSGGDKHSGPTRNVTPFHRTPIPLGSPEPTRRISRVRRRDFIASQLRTCLPNCLCHGAPTASASQPKTLGP